MAYQEKDFQSEHNKWLKYNFKGSGAFELKITKGPSIAFKMLKEHQLHSLWAVKHGSLVFKIPDLGFQNPYDSFKMSGLPAFVVVLFYKGPGKKREFVMIDVDMWAREEKKSMRKSLTEERAREIGKSYTL